MKWGALEKHVLKMDGMQNKIEKLWSKGTDRNTFFDNVFKNIIETSFSPTNLRDFKGIDLDVQN